MKHRYVCMVTHMHTSTNTPMHAHIQKRPYIRIHAYPHTRTQTLAHTHKNNRIHTISHASTLFLTLTRSLSRSFSCWLVVSRFLSFCLS